MTPSKALGLFTGLYPVETLHRKIFCSCEVKHPVFAALACLLWHAPNSTIHCQT